MRNMQRKPLETVNFVNVHCGRAPRPLPFAPTARRGAALSGSFG